MSEKIPIEDSKIRTAGGGPDEADDEEIISITERWSISSSATEEGEEDGSSVDDDDLRRPGLVSYNSNDSLNGIDEREVAFDKLQWILSEIAECNDRFLVFVESEGFEDVLDEMVAFPDDEQIQSIGCCILIHFFRLDAGIDDQIVGVEELLVNVSEPFIKKLEESLLREGLHKVLAHVVRKFTGNARLLGQAFTLLLRVAKSEQVVKYCKLPNLILWSIARHLELKIFVSSALGSLFCRLKHDFYLLYSLADDGILTVLLVLLSEYRDDAPILRSAFQLIFLLLDKDESCRTKAVKIAPSITRAMGEHLDDPILLMACSGIIWYVANEGEDEKVRITTEARAITYLVRVLLLHARNYKLQVLACGALSSLSLSSDPSVMRALLMSRAADALGASLYQHSQRDHVVHPALTILARMDDFLDQQQVVNDNTISHA